MRYPKPLAPGGVIDIVAPAFGAMTEPYRSALANAERRWREAGYTVREWPCVRSDDGIGISSSPARCADELMQAMLDPTSDVVLSCGGGELMCEVAQRLDITALAAASPKWFMGYSDNTNLTFPLACLCDSASIYGPCAPAFGMEPWHPALHDAWDLICGKDPHKKNDLAPTVGSYESWQLVALKDEEHPLAPYNTTEKPRTTAWHVVRDTFEPAEHLTLNGRLIGGCLDVLANLCGTPLDGAQKFNERYQSEGVIWFLESCDLGPFSVRRAICQLAAAGWFSQARGFIFGRPLRIDDEEMGLTQQRAILDGLSEAGIHVPVILDSDLGHLPPSMPIVCGSLGRAVFDADPLQAPLGTLTLEMCEEV